MTPKPTTTFSCSEVLGTLTALEDQSSLNIASKVLLAESSQKHACVGLLNLSWLRSIVNEKLILLVQTITRS